MTKGNGDIKENAKSWAEQVEFDDDGIDGNNLPPREETFDSETQTKTVTEYSINDDGHKVKTIKVYQCQVNRVPKTVAMRRTWKKFGDCSNDAPGPNSANMKIEDDIHINYNISDLNVDEEDDAKSKLKGKTVTCRFCKGDHWSTKCPYKDSLDLISSSTTPAAQASGAEGGANVAAASSSGKYVPPNLRDGGNRRGETMNSKGGRDDSSTIRVTNLSEDTREADLNELFRPFGVVSRVFLAKDRNTGQSKGYAFVSFHNRDDAAKAIIGLSGYGYDHLILQLDWAKPNNK